MESIAIFRHAKDLEDFFMDFFQHVSLVIISIGRIYGWFKDYGLAEKVDCQCDESHHSKGHQLLEAEGY